MLYLFTDGYLDQFGGPNNEKYSSIRFRKMLASIADNGITEQYQVVHDQIDDWLGKGQQIDDMMVVGIRLP